MNDKIEKTEQPNPDDVLSAITSFNDPAIIVGIFKELGWSYTFEIKEWLMMARQNANLAVKSKALIQLRKLLREAAETSGLIANVSSTVPNPQGGHTTFSAKRIAGVLNPAKQIESTEIEGTQNDKIKETRDESNRGCDRGQSQDERRLEGKTEIGERDIKQVSGPEGVDSSDPIRDTGRAFPAGDAGSGGTEPPDGGTLSGQRLKGGATPDSKGCSEQLRGQPKDIIESTSSPISKEDNPCIKRKH